MEVANYISDLLYRYECVVLPHFGAFLTQKLSAEIDAETNFFLAPRKIISFNEQLKQNDGLLASHIVSVEKLIYEDAVTKISDFVGTLKEKLVEGETVFFSKIGHFSLNHEGKIQFIPLEEVNYLTSSFGLGNTKSTPVLREVYKEEVQVLEEKSPITFTPEKRKKSKRSYLKYAAITVLGIGLFSFLGNQYNLKMEEVASHNKMIPSEIDKQAFQKASFFDVSPVEVPEITFNIAVEKKQVGKYHIIAGAFRFEENADKKVEQLIEEGFAARKIGKNKYNLHQVAYESIVDKEDAVALLKSIKKDHNSSAWLLVK